MKKKSLILPLLMLGAMSIAITSCEDDDDKNYIPETPDQTAGIGGLATPKNAFGIYLPTVYAGASVEYNSAKQVSRITDGGKTIVFDYAYMPRTRATGQPDEVTMTVNEYGEQPEIFWFKLNSKGLATQCKEMTGSQSSADFRTWEFAYNNDNQLNYVRKGNRKTMEATYVDADLTELKTKYLYGTMDSVITKISYTSTTVPIVPNLAKVMLFDETMGFDLDNIEYAYIAGLLGTGSNNLPLSSVDSDDIDDVKTYTWTIDSDFLPTSVTESGETPLKFSWKNAE